MLFKQIQADIEKIDWSYDGHNLILVINGFLRSGAYKLKEERIKIQEDERKIMIKLVATKTTDISTQALVPFEKKIEIPLSLSDNWIVECNNLKMEINPNK